MTSPLDTRSKDTVVGTIAAAIQGRLPTVFLSFAKGKVFRALAEAYAGVTLWLQKEVLTVLALTRASTSKGADLDAWMADFGFLRLPAYASSGLVTFSRLTASGSAPVIPVGTEVQTGDGSLRFVVYADPQNGAYSSEDEGYILQAGAFSVDVPVQCVIAGIVGNVAAGAISLLASAAPGIDGVTNAAPFTDGIDVEEDSDFRSRFVLFINSLAKATETAIGSAIRNLGQGLRYTIRSCYRPDGVFQIGYVTVYVDDGSGNPSANLVDLAKRAVDPVRAAGIQVAVVAASRRDANVSLIVQVAPGYRADQVVAAVTAALSVHINGLGLGEPLRYTRLIQIAYAAHAGVLNITNLTLNGGTSDLLPALKETVAVQAINAVPAT